MDDVHLSGKLKTLRRHSRESGNLDFNAARIYRKKPKFKDLDSRLRGNDVWIPACAGMTKFRNHLKREKEPKPNKPDYRLRGNDGSKVTERKITETKQVGFPRGRE
ncbi:hypothetical protein [Neisseria meningitidis]|uniref:hypothetical protein n=1 Tax=Neisseria meningitidis TaxID=487 RepID=UPI00164208C1|nr:hypothetical protein [Neisseria meningitidis]